MTTTQSKNIHDGVHFLNGQEKYLFDVDDYYIFGGGEVLVYPPNQTILEVFNQGQAHDSRIEDWVVVKHILYDRDEMSVYGQICRSRPEVLYGNLPRNTNPGVQIQVSPAQIN
jgi:hypothetical protein